MILSQLTLTNFCLYGGTHTFDLEPSSGKSGVAPIILFGGVNGAGKTTILDAIQLVLYGKRAQCSKRNDKPYDDFLRESVHRGSKSADNASVSLSFRYSASGQADVFHVARSWKVAQVTVRESVRVQKNGEYDDWLSSNWSQVVEEIIPHGISQLCFFDSEKIRYLADDNTTNQALGDAIRSLLGLDLAERLIADADVLRGRILKRNHRTERRDDIENLEQELNTFNEQIQAAVQELASLENSTLAAREQVRKAEEKFARNGGKHWERRTELQSTKVRLEQSRNDLEAKMVELAIGELPLSIIRPALEQVREQFHSEKQSASDSSLIDLLENRDAALTAHLRSSMSEHSVLIDSLDAYLTSDRHSRRTAEREPPRLHLSDSTGARLHHLLMAHLAACVANAQSVLNEHENSERQLSATQRSLNSIPDEESVQAIANKLKSTTIEFATCDQNARRAEKHLATLRFQRDEIGSRLSKSREKAINNEIKSEEDGRITALLDRTRVAMTKYLEVSTAKKIDRLSARITESFKFLMRKQSLVAHVVIDPRSFEISLLSGDGGAISKERLSEGEKQLFAVSVLWGLARASARPLPAIIDTPMGRLDAKHRDNLVERYFPNASHQVIILSTDTEVERTYFDALQPQIARAYHLRYDDTLRTTLAEEGYFWEKCEAIS